MKKMKIKNKINKNKNTKQVIGKIDKDQMTDYSKRRGISFKEAVKWLNPIYNDV